MAELGNDMLKYKRMAMLSINCSRRWLRVQDPVAEDVIVVLAYGAKILNKKHLDILESIKDLLPSGKSIYFWEELLC